MPYEISFIKQLEIAPGVRYTNDCCIGGDVVLDALLPALRERYGELHAIQEDWGWFIWFPVGGKELAIDVGTRDPAINEFCIHLSSRIRRFLRADIIEDTADLEQLRELVVTGLTGWLGSVPAVERLDNKYMPIQ